MRLRNSSSRRRKSCAAEWRTTVVALVVGVDLGEYGLVVRTRIRIALPRIDRIALARHAVLLNGLAHPEVRLAVVRSELNHQGRPQAGDQVVHERQMTGPVAEVTGAIPSRIECPGGQERISAHGRKLRSSRDARPQQGSHVRESLEVWIE